MSDARKVPVGLTIATLISLAILIALGSWQLRRLVWKTDLLARVAALETAAPQPVETVLARRARGADVDYTRVVADCPGLGGARALELYGLRDGQAGSRLISACAVSAGGYRSLLVDRGFVADTISARPPADGAGRAPLRVSGVIRSPDPATFVTPPNQPAANHWYSRDVGAMARALGVEAPAPVFLMAEVSTNPEWKALVPAPLPRDIPNRHLEYAFTWFGLAGALGCVYAALLWRRWKA